MPQPALSVQIRELEARSAEVSVAGFPPPAPSRVIGMVWRRTSPLDERLREIGGIVRGAAKGETVNGETVNAETGATAAKAR